MEKMISSTKKRELCRSFEECKGRMDYDFKVLIVMWTVMGMGAEFSPNLKNLK